MNVAGMAWHGKARLGRHGESGRVTTRLGMARSGRHGTAGLGPAGFGWARRCVASPGLAGRARQVQAWFGPARLGRLGRARLVWARRVTAGAA